MYSIKSRLYLAGLIFALSVTAAGYLQGSEKADSQPIPVKAFQVPTKEGAPLVGMGSLTCTETSDLGFESQGILMEVLVKEGDRVDRGQVLARLENQLAEVELEAKKGQMKAAEANLNFKRGELAKFEDLFKKEAVSESELARASYEAAQAEYGLIASATEMEASKFKKEQRSLKAPFSGVIAKVYMEPGEVVSPNSNKIVRLIGCKELEADIELGEKLFHVVKQGQPAVMTVDSVPNRKLSGTLEKVGKEINARNRTFSVKVRVHEPDQLFRPGMFVRAEIDVSKALEAVWIPESALFRSKMGAEMVYVVKDKVAISRSVRLGRRETGKVHVLDGVNPGDVIIVDGQDRVCDLCEVAVSLVDHE
jgi:membrane fusion protein (multidrug efflux system)